MPNPIKHTSQAIDNWSFDETYQQAAVEILTENAGGTALERQKTIATEETLQAVNEFGIPSFDTQVIDESASPATTTITYKKNGTTVATKTIAVSGTTTTISVTLP